jgi:hypothetical protein
MASDLFQENLQIEVEFTNIPTMRRQKGPRAATTSTFSMVRRSHSALLKPSEINPHRHRVYP